MSEGRAEEFLKRMQKAREYWERASFYLKNYENDRIKSEEKASEDLWGVVSCLMNAISVVELGKPQSRHGNQRKFACNSSFQNLKTGKNFSKSTRMLKTCTQISIMLSLRRMSWRSCGQMSSDSSNAWTMHSGKNSKGFKSVRSKIKIIFSNAQ